MSLHTCKLYAVYIYIYMYIYVHRYVCTSIYIYIASVSIYNHHWLSYVKSTGDSSGYVPSLIIHPVDASIHIICMFLFLFATTTDLLCGVCRGRVRIRTQSVHTPYRCIYTYMYNIYIYSIYIYIYIYSFCFYLQKPPLTWPCGACPGWVRTYAESVGDRSGHVPSLIIHPVNAYIHT